MRLGTVLSKRGTLPSRSKGMGLSFQTLVVGRGGRNQGFTITVWFIHSWKTAGVSSSPSLWNYCSERRSATFQLLDHQVRVRPQYRFISTVSNLKQKTYNYGRGGAPGKVRLPVPCCPESIRALEQDLVG